MTKLRDLGRLSVNFFPQKSKILVNGEIPIYVKLTYLGQKTVFAFRKSVNTKDWDYKKSMMKQASKEALAFNKELSEMKTEIMELFYAMKIAGLPISPQIIKRKYLGQEDEYIAKQGILAYYERHVRQIKKLIGHDYTLGTYKAYYTVQNHLQEFILKEYGKPDLNIENVNPAFVRAFELYLKTDKKCNQNSTIKYLKCIKKITSMARDDGQLKLNPFRGIKFKYKEVDAGFLTEAELKILEEKHFEDERLQVVKDAFVLCCYTGLAYCDVSNLKKSDIVSHNDGALFINKRREKTKTMCTIPLFKPAIEIIKKYSVHPLVLSNDIIIPVISNQKMNDYLKEIATLCEIDKRLTTHMARHTFATSVTLANGISKDVVAKMLGHTSTRMTDKYARVTNDLVFKSTRELAGILQ